MSTLTSLSLVEGLCKSEHVRAEKPFTLGETSLSCRMTHAVFVSACVPHLTVKPERGYKHGEYSRVVESHKSGLTPHDRAIALKAQMESTGKANLKDIREYVNLTGKPFSSTKITELDVSKSDISDVELDMLIRQLPNLESINVSDCSRITAAGFKHIARCRYLQSLTAANCPVVNDVVIKPILVRCLELKSLDVSNSEVTDACFQDIGRKDLKLQKLVLNKCLGITDAGLLHIGNICPALESLSILSCRAVTDTGLQHIGRGCHQLIALNIYHCRRVTATGLQHIAVGCPTIQNIAISYSGVTPAGLRQVGARF